jgi:L-asparagine oxygenase
MWRLAMTAPELSPPLPWHDSEYRIDLTEAERAEVAVLADRLAQTPPGLVDDPQWMAQARMLSCHLPIRLRETVRQYRHDPGALGTVFLRRLPVGDDDLPPTPNVRNSAERAVTRASAVSMLVGLHLGEVIAYAEEKSGALVHNIVPVSGLEGSQSNAGSVPLEFHVENAFHLHRPDYVGLLCLRSDHDRRAGTLVSSIRRVLRLIDRADQAVLREPRFITAPPPSFRMGAPTLPHSILDGADEDPNVCLDFNATVPLDDDAKQVLERLRLVMSDESVSIVLEPGDMAFVDNRIVVHGRTEFTPRYDGRDRWLHRVYVHVDNRRTRSHRLNNGQVLV